MRKSPWLVLFTVLLFVAAPASAFATTVKLYVPPGAAGASQYYEDLPTSKGNVAPPAQGQTSSQNTLASTGSGASGSAALAKLGADGVAASDFAKATAPAAISSTGTGEQGTSGKSGTGGKASGAGTNGTTGSDAAAVLAAANSGSASAGLSGFLSGQDHGGLGWTLPLILIVSLVGAVGYALGRRRGSRTV